MNTRLRWLNEIVLTWLGRIEDEALLQDWRFRITQRLQELERSRHLTLNQLVIGLRECKRGDPLYLERPISRGGETYTTLYFRHYQPRKKRLWACTTIRGTERYSVRSHDRDVYVFNWHDIEYYQVSRTELSVRMRAAKPLEGEGG